LVAQADGLLEVAFGDGDHLRGDVLRVDHVRAVRRRRREKDDLIAGLLDVGGSLNAPKPTFGSAP